MSSRFLLATLLAGLFAFLAQAQPIRQNNPSASSGVEWSGNAATATALAANPADCGTGFVAVGIAASGAAACAVVSDTAGGVDSSTNAASANVVYDHVQVSAAGTHGSASANTVSTLVHRDGSGNFSAGTITASVTGASSLNVLKAGDTMTGGLTIAGASATPFTVGVSTIYVNGATGAVGIGTTAPTRKLDVVSTSTQASFSGWSDYGGVRTDGGSILIGRTSAYTGRLDFSDAGSTIFHMDNTYDIVGARIDFGIRTANPATAITPLSIVGSGNVGVGTTNPLSKLDVAGGIGAYSRTAAQLEAVTPTAAGQIYYCSDCSNSVHVVVSTGSGVCQFDSFTGGVAWH